MQAVKFLDSLIVMKSFRDDTWVELEWNPVIEQMWQRFKLSQTECDRIKDYMEKQREGRIAWGFQQDRMYALDNYWDLYGWDVYNYARSVDNVFDRIKQLLS